MCDYINGFHWGMETTNCTGINSINGTLATLTWPSSFISAAKFIGYDKVASQICTHFSAIDISIDGRNQLLLDVWTDENSGYPCEISLNDQLSNLIITWAFDGFSDLIPPEAYQCTAPKIVCTQSNDICQAKRGLDPDLLGAQLQWVCQPNRVDCTPINPYGDHFQPNNVEAHCNWAFNTYYQANKYLEGSYACDFNGVAQLIKPTTSTTQWMKVPSLKKRSISPLHLTSVISSPDLVCTF